MEDEKNTENSISAKSTSDSSMFSKNPYENISFKDTCRATSGMWMKMQPTKDFIPTGQPACEGCMQRNGDHICDKEKYINSLK